MNYTKPEVAVLGEADQVIQGHGKTSTVIGDGSFLLKPAYDLDE